MENNGGIVSCKIHNIKYNTQTIDTCPLCLQKIGFNKEFTKLKYKREILKEPIIEFKNLSLEEFKKTIPTQIYKKTDNPYTLKINTRVITILYDNYHINFSKIARFLNYESRATVFYHYNKYKKTRWSVR